MTSLIMILLPSLTLNTGLSINLELNETFQTLSASQSKFMEQSISDSRLWLNHSWLSLRVYIFEHNVIEKNKQQIVKHRGSLCQFKFNPSIFLLPYSLQAFISEKMYQNYVNVTHRKLSRLHPLDPQMIRSNACVR